MKTESHVINCFIKSRADTKHPLFIGDGVITAYLDGYAIIPLEDYQELTGEDMSDMLKHVHTSCTDNGSV